MRGIEARAVDMVAGDGTAPVPAGPPGDPLRPGLVASLVRQCSRRRPARAAVVFPVDDLALAGALEAQRAGVVSARLIGPDTRMRDVAASAGLDLGDVEVTDVPDEDAAVAAAVEAARRRQVDLIVKGSVHSGSLLHAVLAEHAASPLARRASHVFVLQMPHWPRLLLLTDAVVNIAPTLIDKADICRNAVDLATALGIPEPRVAVLGAVEDVEASMPQTLHAAALAQMGRRGQLGRAVVDGPLALDDALDPAALRVKGFDSPIAGKADVLVVPTLEAGNILYKGLVVLGGAVAAGLVVGAPLPVVLASRADSVDTRVASAALGSIWFHRHDPAREA